MLIEKNRLLSQFHNIYIQIHRKQKIGKNNNTNWAEMPWPRLLLFSNTWWSHWKCRQLARMWWVINYALWSHQRLIALPYLLTRSLFRLNFPEFLSKTVWCPNLIHKPFQDCVAFTPSLAKPGFGRVNLLILKTPQSRCAPTIQMRNSVKKEDVDWFTTKNWLLGE